MKREIVKNTAICTENGEDFFAKWFYKYTEKGFIKHVDTLYFMVTPDIEDYEKSERWKNFIERLLKTELVSKKTGENIPVFEDVYKGLEVAGNRGAQMYSLHFGLEDSFDIFTCVNVPNSKTPPIQVQVRSQSLWIDGLQGSFDKAYACIEKVLKSFDMNIKKVQDNRIDYAFHTNYINNFKSFFAENDLGKMFVANFKRGRKDYNFHTCEDDKYGDREVESDYMTLGRHKSNNVFFRAYNKTKEVIEQGYKQFFIPIWKQYGLISDFDEYILKKTFVYGTYESKDKARCEFYYDYGKDKAIREEIYDKLKSPDTPAKWYVKRAKGLVPDITIISNIEIQTKHKFYDRLNLPQLTADESPKKSIYNLFEQMSELISFLTEDTIRFVNYKGKNAKIERTKRPMADWWIRLRNAKSVEITDLWDIDYIRTYQHNLDIERQKQLSINKMASMGAYMNVTTGIFEIARETESDIKEDVKKFLTSLNDNDVKKYYRKKKKKAKEIMRKLED
jgi:hypothetical protein